MLNKPQRQEPVGLVIEVALSAFKLVKAFWPLLLMLVIKGTDDKGFKILMYGLILVGIAAVIAILRFVNFKFYIDEVNHEFVLQKGILSKDKIIIKLDKVFEVNLEQKYLHILLGVFKVTLDTASSEKNEVVIQSLSKQNANLLRTYILNYKNENHKITILKPENDELVFNEIVAEKPIETEIKISFLSLFKSSIISNYGKTIGLIIVFFNTILENLKNLNETFLSTYINNDALTSSISNSVAMVTILFILFVILLNTVLGFLQYFGYSITKTTNQLIIKYGLIQKFQIIVKPNRIQYFTSFNSKLIRFFNTYNLQLALIGDPNSKKQKNNIKIPALTLINLKSIKQYLGIESNYEQLYFSFKPNFRFVIQNMFILTALIIVVVSYIYFLGDYMFVGNLINKNSNYITTVLLGFWLLMFVLQLIVLKKYSIKLYTNSIVFSRGILSLQTTVLPIKNIQSVKLKQAWWHQNNNLATLELQTAGGRIVLPISKKDIYQKMTNYILFELESKNKAWM